MLIMSVVIALIVAIGLSAAAHRYRSEGCAVGAILWWIIVVGLLIACMCIWPMVATEHTIDQKIAMYEEENEQIEAEIDVIVKQYMEYEKKTFEEIAPESGADTMVLVSLFPELKSDALVQQQINLHTSNTQQIKRLKAEKIDLSLLKWILYFGN